MHSASMQSFPAISLPSLPSTPSIDVRRLRQGTWLPKPGPPCWDAPLSRETRDTGMAAMLN